MSKKILPISLCTFVKNEEKNIRGCIESVFPIVQEVVVVDCGSTDNTIEIAKEYTDRVYSIPFSDFGNIRTLTAHFANAPWVFMLDADERILSEDWPIFEELINQPIGITGNSKEFDENGNIVIDSWAIPRKRWKDKKMTIREDAESYPDWQVRLFRNHQNRAKIYFRRRVHEQVAGCIRTEQSIKGPIIQHFQNTNKDESKLLERQKFYENLRALDVAEGVIHDVPATVKIDKVTE